MSIKIPGVNSETGFNLYGNDEEFYAVILRSFLKNTPASLEKLKNLSQETLPDYATAVHGLKGTSSNIGAEELQAAAAKLEALAKAGDLAAVTAGNGALIKQAETLLEHIKNWLLENDPGS